jgi:hypothetical protein
LQHLQVQDPTGRRHQGWLGVARSRGMCQVLPAGAKDHRIHQAETAGLRAGRFPLSLRSRDGLRFASLCILGTQELLLFMQPAASKRPRLSLRSAADRPRRSDPALAPPRRRICRIAIGLEKFRDLPPLGISTPAPYSKPERATWLL